jgi:hypothetical protein
MLVVEELVDFVKVLVELLVLAEQVELVVPVVEMVHLLASEIQQRVLQVRLLEVVVVAAVAETVLEE